MDFTHLARLSKLSFTKEEQARLQKELQEIIALMDEIQEAPERKTETGTIPPSAYKVLREDAVVSTAPEGKYYGERYHVPKVVGSCRLEN